MRISNVIRHERREDRRSSTEQGSSTERISVLRVPTRRFAREASLQVTGKTHRTSGQKTLTKISRILIMNISKDWDWSQMAIGFWSGVAVISLINIAMIVVHHNQFLYDEYIFGISIVALIVYVIVRCRSARQ